MNTNLVVQSLLIVLVAFISYMHCYIGSTMSNRPIIVAPLVGLVLGDLTLGIQIGATLELIFLGAVPIGASNPPDMVSGTIIGTSFVILSGSNIGAAVALAVPVATLVLLFDNLLMMFVLTSSSHMADKYAKLGDYKAVERIVVLSSIGNKLILALVVGFAFYIGIPVIEQVLEVIPAFIITGMDVAAGMLPAIGFAMLAKMLLTKELFAYLLAGFLLAAYFQLPVFGIALVGLVIALLIFHTKTGNNMEVNVDDNEF